MDFNLNRLKQLYKTILEENYKIITFNDYLQSHSKEKSVILRHDVDKRILNSLEIALLEYDLGIKSSFYFRYKKKTFKKNIIKQIESLGHEIGYHYEVLSMTKGNLEQGIALFKKQLAEFRRITDIRTICMHGSPLSKWDNKNLWGKYDYHEYGIIGEPYFDINFENLAYFSDTGRRWNGDRSNIRDKVAFKKKFNIKTTNELISAFKEDRLPKEIMINIHPQRWSETFIPWFWELVNQNVKNVFKRYFTRRNEMGDLGC